MALAESTPLPSLSSSIYWYLSRDETGRQQLIRKMNAVDEASANQLLQLLHFALQGDSRLPKPTGWDVAFSRFNRGTLRSTATEV
jgi:hypothetical protein